MSAQQRDGNGSIKIPPLSTTFAEVVQLYRSGGEAEQNERLVEIVERDAATSAYVLKLVNSAYFGLRREVSQIDRAITLLGFKPVCNVVLTVGLKETFAQLEDPQMRGVYDYVMRTSVATGLFGRDLCTHLGLHYPDTTFAAGLICQLGRLILLFTYREAYAGLWYHEASDQPLAPPLPHERQRLGTVLQVHVALEAPGAHAETRPDLDEAQRAQEQAVSARPRLLPVLVLDLE